MTLEELMQLIPADEGEAVEMKISTRRHLEMVQANVI